jgi:hypothetical protein
MMKSVAAKNPLGKEFFYKVMALGEKLNEEFPELASLTDEGKKEFLDKLLMPEVAKHIEASGTVNENPCNLICYEEFVLQSAYASVVLSASLAGCGLTGAFAQTCVILSAGIYAVMYSVELGYLWSCVEKCTSDVIEIN